MSYQSYSLRDTYSVDLVARYKLDDEDGEREGEEEGASNCEVHSCRLFDL